jgi:hypothetical protein
MDKEKINKIKDGFIELIKTRALQDVLIEIYKNNWSKEDIIEYLETKIEEVTKKI